LVVTNSETDSGQGIIWCW